MQPDARPATRLPLVGIALPEAWQKPLLHLAFVWLATIALASHQWSAMVTNWVQIDTYQHILFIPPILAWLVWVRRQALAALTPVAWWPGLVGFGVAALVWVVASIGSIDLIAQAGAVLMLQTATLAVLGPRIGAVLAFPLFYACFLVPFGEEVVGPLQMFTAHMTIALTALSGIPASVEGVFIDTPAGLFEVAEACAGVQFVVAMVTLGILVARLCLTQWRMRAAFLALCFVVPILTNGVRAWSTIWFAQHLGIETAAGIDHLIYGWVFFAVVVALVLGIGWRWFDRDPTAEARSAARDGDRAWVIGLERFSIASTVATSGIVAMLVLALAWTGLARAGTGEVPPITPPDLPGWQLSADRIGPIWEPRAITASYAMLARYRDGQGQVVELYLARYDGDADATVSYEGAVPRDTPWRYVEPAPAPDTMRGERLLAYGTERRLAWIGYVHGDHMTGDPMRHRLSRLGARLALDNAPGWLVIVSTPASGDEGETALREFLSATGSLPALVRRASVR